MLVLLSLALLLCCRHIPEVAADGIVWDANFTVASENFPLNGLSNASLLRVLLYPPSSSWAFLPAMYAVPPSPGLDFTMSSCTITTLCSSVAAYASFMNRVSSGSIYSSERDGNGSVYRLVIASYVSSQANITVTLSNWTIQCDSSTDASYSAANVVVYNSSAFLSAMSALAILGVDSNVKVEGLVTVSNTTGWPVWPEPGFIMGHSASMNFSSDSGNGYIDFMMNADRIVVPTGQVQMNNVKVVNLCALNTFFGKSLGSSSTMSIEGLLRPGMFNVSDTFLIVPRLEVIGFVYWYTLITSLKLTEAQLDDFVRSIGVRITVYNPDKDTVVIQSLESQRTTYTNVAMRASDVPATLPSPAQLMPFTMCAPGSLSADDKWTPNATQSPNPRWPSPLYPITEGAQLKNLLPALTQYASNIASSLGGNLTIYVPPIAIQYINISLASLGTAQAIFLRNVLWVGPLAPSGTSVSGSPNNLVLDLSLVVGAFGLGGTNYSLSIERLTLINPVVSTEFRTNSGFSTIESAIPLWMVQFVRNYNAIRVLLHSVTVVLPVESFLPLHALAAAGGLENLAMAREASGASDALLNPVLDRILSFNVTSYTMNEIALNHYSGWGVNATNLLFRNGDAASTTSPPPASVAAVPLGQLPADSASSGENSVSWKPIVIGVVAGFFALLLASVPAWFLWRRYQERQLDHFVGMAAKKNPLDEENGSSSPGHSGAFTAMRGSVSALVLAEVPDSGGSEKLTNSANVSAARDKSISQPISNSSKASSSARKWDPMKEVEEMAGKVQSKESMKLKLLEPIGAGAFGKVYRGRWRGLDVAVKTVLFASKQGGTDAPEKRAIMEAAISSSVVHPNVVSTYHYDIKPVSPVASAGSLQIEEIATDWKLYLVQELCFASLADVQLAGFLHDKETKLPRLDLVLGALEDVAKGMAHIHGNSIIHGDLKPENVLTKCESDGSGSLICKITDFGLCSTLDPLKSHISCFNNGTPFYAAPEIAMSGRVTKASDVYSYGVLMVEMYKNLTPWFTQPSGVFAVNPKFSVFSEGTPALFVSLAKRCMDPKPRNRPSFSEVVCAVTEMLTCYSMGWDNLEMPKSTGAGQPATLSEAAVHPSNRIQDSVMDSTLDRAVGQAPNRGAIITPEALVSVRGLKGRQVESGIAEGDEKMLVDKAVANDVGGGSTSNEKLVGVS